MTAVRIYQLEQEILRLNSQLSLKDEQIAFKDEQIVLKEEQIALKDEQLERKNERILYLERQLFGRRSEKRLPDNLQGQLSLFDPMQGSPSLEEENGLLSSLAEEISHKAEQRRERAKHKAATGKRSYQIPAHIERRERVVEPVNPDGKAPVKIGRDVSERLMLEPSKFWVERIIRPIYREREAEASLSAKILQAAPAPTILPGCMAGEPLLSQIIADKFLYHIPEYRQAVRFKALGVDITTSSINRRVHAVADKLYPLYIAQMEKVLSTDYIQVDETTLPVTDRPGSARKAYVWAVRSVLSPGLFFHYDKGSRSQEVILKLLKDYRGALQSDGYAAYSIYEDKQGVLPLGCLAHVRRKFENALDYSPEAQKGLDYIGLLYMLEANLRGEGADCGRMRSERMEKAWPILQQMERWMKQVFNTITPKSPPGKAISYAFGMWPRISRYCHDGRFEIDNNGIENAIRAIALGRKNYLFSGNNGGAEDNCVFYTLLGS
jgi:transposase